MKTNAFREQVTMLNSWFKNWSECEQTVAIYSLLKRSSPVQAKFLQQVLQHFLSDCSDVKALEEKANDEEYVRSLRSKEKDVLHQLLHLLPLLKVGEDSAKAAYLELIPDHLSHTILNGVNIEESRQLISFSLIHPAISAEERGPLHGWLVYLDDRFAHCNSTQNNNNFNNNVGSNNRLAVGSSSSSSSGGSNNPSHSPSPVSPSHRSISQSSLCPESNQDFNQVIGNPNMLSPHVLPGHNTNSHSPSPTINLWQQHQQSQQFHNNQPQGHSSGFETNPPGQSFNPASGGNFSNSSLAVSSSNSINHSTSSISPAQRSVSQNSLCPDLSQDQNSIGGGSGMRPLPGHSPGPAMNPWQQQLHQQHQQQLYQQHIQGNQSCVDPSSAQNPNDVSGYGQFAASPNNGHKTLRATNSHVGTFGASQGHMPLKASASAPPNFSVLQPPSSKSQDKSTHSTGGQQRDHARLSRTRSVVPPARLQQQKTFGSSRQLTRSATTDHAPLSPQSSVTSSESSDSHHEDGPPLKEVFMEECSGMKNLLVWLREMRLHKYFFLFRHMTYEELLNLSEEWLLQNNVTRGARQRFMTNIEKLRERQSLLRTLEKSILEGGSIILALYEMKVMLITPIKAFTPEHTDLTDITISPSPSSTTPTDPTGTSNELPTGPDTPTSASTSPSSSTLTLTTSSPSSSAVPSSSPSSSSPQSPSDDVAEGDLPSQFCRLLGKVCQQLLLATRPDEHCFQLYLQLIDKCLKHDAFTADQKKLLLSRKQAAEKIWNPPPQRYKPNRSWWGGNTYPLYQSFGSRIIPRSNRAPVPGNYQQQQMQWRQQQQRHQYQGHHRQHGHQPWSSGSSRPMGGHQAVTRNSSWNPAYLKPGLMEPPAKQPLSRTQSAPINRPLSLPIQASGDDTEINARLDSLCARMTEQALGNSEQADSKGSGFSLR